MHFTDIFIKRPVLATVVSLVILLLGVRAFFDLTVRQYPELQNAQITVAVAYPGAGASLIEGFITTPLEREIATVDGIDYLLSATGQGSTGITVNLRLDKDPNEALTEISAKVNKLRNELPDGSEDPVIAIKSAGGTSPMYLSFFSEVLEENEITDYLTRVVEPSLATLPGVEQARIIGAQTFAMRVWLKPDRLVAHDLTAGEVLESLRQQNVLSAVGETRGNYVKIGLTAATDLHTTEEFRQLILKSDGEATIRLGDVASVVLGAESYDQSAGWNGDPAIFIAIEARPDANVLDVIKGVREVWPGIKASLPEGLEGAIGYDSTLYIQEAIGEVQTTLLEAVVIVILVIYLFLGSLRSSFIPAVTVPLSLIGAMFLMLILGFSINLLTLLAMVLAIGMVVDDAIIVLENVHRHIEGGLAPRDAAIKGARELVWPVISMTLTLVAVFAPLGFQPGITGKLFVEFAFTLAGAVLISGVVALTLTPMMCAYMLKPHGSEGRLAIWLDKRFESWKNAYKKRLHGALDTVHVIGIFSVLVFASMIVLAMMLPGELAPGEDRGFAIAINEIDGYASQEYLDEVSSQAHKVALAHEDISHMFTFSRADAGSTNRSFMGMITKPWSERDKTTATIVNELKPGLSAIPGLRSTVIQPPPLPTPGQGYPIEFIIKSTADAQSLVDVGNELLGRAMATKKFIFLVPRLRIDRPEAVIDIDRDKAALLGVDMRTLSRDLSALLAGGTVNRFSYADRSYKVIAQVERSSRLNPQQLEGFYTRAANGEQIPISTLVTVTERTVPRTIEHMQQLSSNTLIGAPRPGVSEGEAVAALEEIAEEILPPGFQIDYGGKLRQYKQEGQAFIYVLLFAVITIYLLLAAQFESFLDPLIILVTVPMAISGALLVLNLFSATNGMLFIPGMGLVGKWTDFPGMTLNIYTQVGLVTLIGVIAKHGILIVEFANSLQEQGMAKREAIEEATAIRMRPILMTTAALVIAMVPLLISQGPGSSARFSMGLVIAAGMTIGTLFTLYVVPAMYLYLGRDYAKRPKGQGVKAEATP